MLRTVRLKFFFLFLLTIFSILLVLPSFTDSMPEWWKKHISKGIYLGLDLRGGVHLILEVDMQQAISNYLGRTGQELKGEAEKRKLSLKVGEVKNEALPLTLTSKDEQNIFQNWLKTDFPQLDLQGPQFGPGGLTYSLVPKPEEIIRLRDDTLKRSLEVMRNRVDQFGVTEPLIATQGADKIVIQLPGLKDPQRALNLIGELAQLEFKMVDESSQVNLETLIDQALKDGKLKTGEERNRQALNRALADKIPAEDEIYIEKKANRDTGRVEYIPLLIKKKVMLSGDAVKDASLRLGDFGEPEVHVDFSPRGATEFGRITGENVKKRMAIILDGVVRSAPVIQEKIGGGKARISGNFSSEEAQDLRIVLRAGSLPATVKIVQNITVGPTLGADSIRQGFLSGILGTLLVVAFMLFYYRFSGIVANYALVLNVIMLLGALSILGATLTLPGIAGIILSIGMAVDSNVLIYERMREEFHAGKPIKSGIDGGYDKAFWTIIDSHVTTLITAVVLFWVGTGPIKGFAVTLSLGVILNLFTALFGTRVVYDWLVMKRWLKKLSFFELFSKPDLDFIGKRRYAFIVSGVLSTLGIVAFTLICLGYGNLGVEFSGGAMVRFHSAKPFHVDEVRQVLSQAGWGHAEIQEVKKPVTGEVEGLIVKVKKSQEAVGQMSEKMSQSLNKDLPAYKFTVAGTEEIGASVSADLRLWAIVAIILSMLGIVAYIAWRFEFVFGLGALVATFHDVLAVLGIFFLLHKEITLLVVTALLTLAGYSLTDTVVVFDRIRENLGRSRDKLGDIINHSVNEVLSRTIVTSSTVFLVVVAIFLFGGAVLRDFALAMIMGVLVGTYSSVFVASPIVYAFRKGTKRVAVKKEKVAELAAQKQKKEDKKATGKKRKK